MTCSRILLDFDGVIFQNQMVQSRVAEKSIKFLKAHGKFKSNDDALYFNSTRYPVFGHTALLLKDNPMAVSDYNASVFDADTMRTIRSWVSEYDYRRLRKIKSCIPAGVKVHLCTNAPLMYCEAVMSSLSFPLEHFFDPECSFTSDDGIVKPQTEFWSKVESHPYFSEGDIHLIDDSLTHVLSVRNRDRWVPHYITNDWNLHYLLTSKSIYTNL